jgi:hypothetical protein
MTPFTGNIVLDTFAEVLTFLQRYSDGDNIAVWMLPDRGVRLKESILANIQEALVIPDDPPGFHARRKLSYNARITRDQ